MFSGAIMKPRLVMQIGVVLACASAILLAALYSRSGVLRSGKFIVASGYKDTLTIIDLSANNPRQELTVRTDGHITHISYMLDTTWLVVSLRSRRPYQVLYTLNTQSGMSSGFDLNSASIDTNSIRRMNARGCGLTLSGQLVLFDTLSARCLVHDRGIIMSGPYWCGDRIVYETSTGVHLMQVRNDLSILESSSMPGARISQALVDGVIVTDLTQSYLVNGTSINSRSGSDLANIKLLRERFGDRGLLHVAESVFVVTSEYPTKSVFVNPVTRQMRTIQKLATFCAQSLQSTFEVSQLQSIDWTQVRVVKFHVLQQ